MENYKQMYESALEQAEELYNNCSLSEKEKLEKIFPVLDKDKNKKMLAKCVLLIKRAYADFESKKCIAWIENTFFENEQLKQKATWTEEDEHRRADAIYFLQSAKRHYADTSEIEATIDWLKKLYEHTEEEPTNNVVNIPVNWTEEDDNYVKRLCKYLKTTTMTAVKLEFIDWLESLSSKIPTITTKSN